MTETLYFLDPDHPLGLQGQIRQQLVQAILLGTLPANSRLPSSRKLADQLGVARNTVVLAYQQLVDEGYLESRERSGVYVNPQILDGQVAFRGAPAEPASADLDWRQRLQLQTADPGVFEWPSDWQQHPYPFIDGYYDESLYPVSQWREASRLALGGGLVRQGTASEASADDPQLIEEIRTRVLPRRGINARPDEILVTIGEQNALYLLTRLLVAPGARVAMEEPGNPRMRRLLAHADAEVHAQPVDEHGMVVDERLDACALAYVTPSHQHPTAVTMPNERRRELLDRAAQRDLLIIEDDQQGEQNYVGQPHPALRGMDRDGRVVYVSALPRVLAPGLRLGFIVAAPGLIREARSLRQLMIG
ncbi:MAG: PLP-dependent aminotransferase family protein, partial [Xanthomonadales bacterium]|nr:PLP-dependent aminotransferase family protein [Xanthomonadales bacterium]